MSIYIKGMKMPKNCNECPTCRDGTTLDGDYWLMCGYNGKPLESEIAAGKPDWCPLISIPPHGRCVDADELKRIIANAKHMDADIFEGKMMYSDHLCIGADYDDVCAAIDEMPTIIPADQVEDEKT